MMATMTVIFEESLHHVCLMHGLKQKEKHQRHKEYGRALILEEYTFY